jgi:hypothetical protein
MATKNATPAITRSFTAEKETKNAIRFQEDEVEGQAPAIGQLYVQKHAVPKGCTKLTVTIAPVVE